jgi:nicotinate-nucleotide adenylyltransferase
MPAPLRIPSAARVVVFFGGTFDPVHLGHTQIGSAARDRLGADAWLVFVPARQSPLKPAGPAAAAADRVDMLGEALRAVPRTALWTDELDRPAPSYWVDTLGRARTLLGDAVEMRFLIGADQAAQFHRWKEPERILELAQPLVLAREPWASWPEMEAALAAPGCWSVAQLARWRTWFLDDLVMPISATEVRAALAAKPALAQQWLDPSVLKIIEERGLYQDSQRA